MNPFLRFALGLALLAVLAWAGTIEGHVELIQRFGKRNGPPRDVKERMQAGELERTVIYLDAPGLPPPEPETGTIEQKHKQFLPEILVVPAGSTVNFPNRDSIFHNAFSLSKIKRFDLGYFPEGQSRAVRFEKPGLVQVYCRLHSNMGAMILVTPNRWYARPAADGNFTLEDVPPGLYTLVVWNKSARSVMKTIQMPLSGKIRIDVEISVFDMSGGR